MNKKRVKKKSRTLSKHLEAERQFHEKHAKELIKTSESDLIWQIPENELFIKKYLTKSSKWILLDLGCGSALNIKRNVLPLLSKQRIYVGIDISLTLIAEAKRNIPNGIFMNKPMSKVRFPKESIDFISFFGSLHHDENPEKTFKIVTKFLKIGGYLFLREPEEKAFKKGFGASPYEGGIKKEKLKRWSNENNLQIIEWHFLNTFPFHFTRKILNRLKLGFFERIPLFWNLKLKIELLLERIFNNYLTLFNGTDMFVVLRKRKI